MRVVTVVCDVCGVQKREANRWYCVSSSGDRIVVLFGDRMHSAPGSGEWLDICGSGCLVRWLTRVVDSESTL